MSDEGRVSLALRDAGGGIAATVRLPCVGASGLPVLAEDLTLGTGGTGPAH